MYYTLIDMIFIMSAPVSAGITVAISISVITIISSLLVVERY